MTEYMLEIRKLSVIPELLAWENGWTHVPFTETELTGIKDYTFGFRPVELAILWDSQEETSNG